MTFLTDVKSIPPLVWLFFDSKENIKIEFADCSLKEICCFAY